MNASLPENEAGRLAALHDHKLLDTAPEEQFDDLVRLAAQVCGTPIAALSLVDEQRQWFKAITGLNAAETPRAVAFCAHTILQTGLLVVPDATQDERFADNSLVTGEDTQFRFYAGVPLVTEDGFAMGSLCVIDRVARTLTSEQEETLRLLARQASSHLRAARRIAERESLVAEKHSLVLEKERLAAIIEHSEEAIMAATLDGILVSWNAGASQLYGYSAAEMIGRHASCLVPVGEPNSVPAVTSRLLRGESVPPMEAARVRGDGTKFRAMLSFSPIQDAAGSVVGISCIARDITAMKAAEEALAEAHAALAQSNAHLSESEVRLRRLTDAAFEGIAIAQDGALVDVNPAFAALFGCAAPSEMVGVDVSQIVALESRALVRQKIEDRDEAPYEAVLQRRDGTTFQAELRGRTIHIGGRVAQITAVRDISARKAMEMERRASHRALEESQARLVEAQRIGCLGDFTMDLTTRRLTWSAEMFRLFEFDPECGEPSYDAALARYHPEDRAERERQFAYSLGTGEPYVCDIRLILPSGTPRWVHLVGHVVSRADGHPTDLTGVVMDVTEQKTMEVQLLERAERLRQSEAGLRAVLEGAPVILYATDAGGTVTLSEGMGLAALGLKPGEVVGRSVFEFGGGDAEIEAKTRRALAGETVSYELRLGGLSLHSELRPVFGADGSPNGLIGVCFDVTERAVAEERFRVLFEQSSDAHLLLGEQGIIDCNAATVTLLRCQDKAEVLGLHPAVMSPEFQPDGRLSREKKGEMDALARENGFHRFEWVLRKTDGQEFPVEVSLTPVTVAGRPVLLSVMHDLTERKQDEEKLQDYAIVLEVQKQELEQANADLAALATSDGLTGLKNHRAFQERLAVEVGLATRHGEPLSLIILDVDHFKQYNDTYGHPAGDAVLRAVALALREGVRDTDLAARYGGEEFVLLLPQTDLDGAAVVAERVRGWLESHSWSQRAVTASFGVAALHCGECGADLIARADAAMYDSKISGRNRVTYGIGSEAICSETQLEVGEKKAWKQ